MTNTFRSKLLILFLVLSASVHLDAREPDSKKLQVFILAGQSNMVGHANYITIPRLFADERSAVQNLAGLVFKPGTNVTRAAVDAQIAVRIERDAINNQIRKKEIVGEQQIAAARKQIEVLQADYDGKTSKIKGTFAVSDRVYISSIADNSRKSGPLTVGYGGSVDKIGPELGFGMSLAKHLDAPILIIKTSWGGKSLHYNFRPPSAGAYELNEKELASDRVEQINKDTGLNYRMMTEKVDEVLANLKDYHPAYDESVGFDLAGFVWFQGWNDMYGWARSEEHTSELQSRTNLVCRLLLAKTKTINTHARTI